MFIDGDGEGGVREEGGIEEEDWSKSGDEKGRRMALRPLSARVSLCAWNNMASSNVVRKFSPLSIIACNIRIGLL
ncbi:unnamed protein product [Musa acuminata subsp. burmannicoides]